MCGVIRWDVPWWKEKTIMENNEPQNEAPKPKEPQITEEDIKKVLKWGLVIVIITAAILARILYAKLVAHGY